MNDKKTKEKEMKKLPSPPPYFNQRKELEGVRLVAKLRYKNLRLKHPASGHGNDDKRTKNILAGGQPNKTNGEG